MCAPQDRLTWLSWPVVTTFKVRVKYPLTEVLLCTRLDLSMGVHAISQKLLLGSNIRKDKSRSMELIAFGPLLRSLANANHLKLPLFKASRMIGGLGLRVTRPLVARWISGLKPYEPVQFQLWWSNLLCRDRAHNHHKRRIPASLDVSFRGLLFAFRRMLNNDEG
jgi:hypothetical protein